MIQSLILVFILNIISTTLSTLKTIFIVKKIRKPAYFVIFIDALIFGYGLKLVTDSNSLFIFFVFALGKVLGTYIGDIIEEKLALGILEVTVYGKEEKILEIADNLRLMGYSVTTHKGYGYNGRERFSLDITLKRKEFTLLKQILEKYGYKNATMIVKEVKSIGGKINPSIK